MAAKPCCSEISALLSSKFPPPIRLLQSSPVQVLISIRTLNIVPFYVVQLLIFLPNRNDCLYCKCHISRREMEMELIFISQLAPEFSAWLLMLRNAQGSERFRNDLCNLAYKNVRFLAEPVRRWTTVSWLDVLCQASEIAYVLCFGNLLTFGNL